MLIGQYLANIGDKKRLSVPKKFRQELGSKLIITRGFENCLVIVNETSWKDITSDVSEASYGLQEMRDVSRFLIGGAAEIELDSQGRFVIPDNLYKYAELQNEVCFVGLMRWIEVWDKNKWDKSDSEIRTKNAETAQNLNAILNKS
jgi:MraZ protein